MRYGSVIVLGLEMADTKNLTRVGEKMSTVSGLYAPRSSKNAPITPMTASDSPQANWRPELPFDTRLIHLSLVAFFGLS